MTPESRLSGEELLETFFDIVLDDDELLAAEFADIVDGLTDDLPPTTTSVESTRGGSPGIARQHPRRQSERRRRTDPVAPASDPGVRSPPESPPNRHPPDR